MELLFVIFGHSNLLLSFEQFYRLHLLQLDSLKTILGPLIFLDADFDKVFV
jgi:hypothetical protein